MGTWGPAIFSDDTACDVRADYRDLLSEGKSGPEATDQLIADWKTELEDPDEGPTFWLALAATQWSAGRLEERVRVRALAVIADGSSMARWGEGKDASKRRNVLDKLEMTLKSPQPPQKKFAKRFKQNTDFVPGDVFRYTTASGTTVLFAVLTLTTDKGGTAPVIQLLDWSDPGAVPENLDKLSPYRRTFPKASYSATVSFIVFVHPKKNPYPEARITRIGRVDREDRYRAAAVTWWGDPLDYLLEEALASPAPAGMQTAEQFAASTSRV